MWEDLGPVPSLDRPSLAFIPSPGERPALEIRINFGIFTGRAATPAEIDRLAEWLLDIVDGLTIVCEERHEIGGGAEASVHQVRIELPPDGVPVQGDELRQFERRLLERCDYWARGCIESRRGPESW
jgi:hypothetical protein